MDEMVLRPAVGIAEEQATPQPAPWLERRKLGFLRAWLRTVGQALVHPTRLIESVPAGSSATTAAWFAFMTMLPAYVVCLVPFGLMGLGMAAASGGGGPPWIAMVMGMAILGVLCAAGMILWLLLWWGVTHGVLYVVARPAAGPRRTFQALCYSAGANATTAAPCLGMYVGPIWWLVSAVVMVARGHKVSAVRAALAVLALPVLSVVAAVGFEIVLLGWLIPMSVRSSVPGVVGSSTAPYGIQNELCSYAYAHDGKGPTHALVLVERGRLRADDFFYTRGIPGNTRSLVPGTTVGAFRAFSPAERAAIVEATVQALPPSPVIHCVGDYIFTYHGIDLKDPLLDGRLWFFVVVPGRSEAVPDAPTVIYVGFANGALEEWDVADLPMRLLAQNRIRAKCGLPPLPDLPQVSLTGQVSPPTPQTAPAEPEDS